MCHGLRRSKDPSPLNAHPDAAAKGLCSALAEAYAEGARSAQREVRHVDLSTLDFGLLRSQAEFEKGQVSPAIGNVQHDIVWCDHLVVVFPLWLGDVPALLKAFLEQALRPGFAFTNRGNGLPVKHLKGRSAHVIVTMGMPAFIYRWYFRAHGLKNLKRNILQFVGFRPVRATIVGSVGTASKSTIERRIAEVRALGRRGL